MLEDLKKDINIGEIKMKTKSRIFKARISIQENGEINVMSYSNRLIPSGMLNLLNKKVHEAATEWNGERNWMKEYIEFSYKGASYHQIDSKGLCDGCAFYDFNLSGAMRCSHPFFSTKPNCTGKIYVRKEGGNK